MTFSAYDAIKDTRAWNLLDRVCTAGSLVIFGAGSGGRYLHGVLKDRQIEAHFFCDNNAASWGSEVLGLRVLSPRELFAEHSGALILIASNWARDIAHQLRYGGCDNIIDLTCWDDRWDKNFNPDLIYENLDQISKVAEYMEDDWSRNLYLSLIKFRLNADPSQIEASPFAWYNHPKAAAEPDDIVFDVGPFDGKTSLEFAQRMGNRGKVIAFEPDEVNYDKTSEAFASSRALNICELEKLGFWSSNTQMSFMTDQRTGSQNRISEAGEQLVQLVSVDWFVETKKIVPSLIKMDIEGAELNAIKGARSVLRTYKPKLQICLYHEPDDMWTIPETIKSFNPEYKFYLGHHSQNLFETVLYAY